MRRLFIVLLMFVGSSACLFAAERPNIVLILADDLGYGDVQCLNPQRGRIATPHLDRLAAKGMTFSDAHSGASVCTPTRYGLLTGRYAWRTRLQRGVLDGGNDPSLIEKDRLNVQSLLRKHDYTTACVGKWHLGFQSDSKPDQASGQRGMGYDGLPVGAKLIDGPTTRGFDEFWGCSNARSMASVIEGDRVVELLPPIEMLPRLTQRAVQFIDTHAEQAKSDRPFFLYVPLTSPHTPIVPSRDWQGKSPLGSYGDFVMQTDDTVGQILAALDRHELEENTLVVFTSDNGCSPQAGTEQLEELGHYASAQYRGYKSDIWDGGHRVPLLVRWPGVTAAGSSSDEIICLTDFLASVAELLGAELPDDAAPDSVSFLPALRGELIVSEREAIVHHSISGQFAIRDGKWKLNLCAGSGGWSRPRDDAAEQMGLPRSQLYDLNADPGEMNNLIDSEPDQAERLTALLRRYIDQGRSTAGPKLSNDVKVSYALRTHGCLIATCMTLIASCGALAMGQDDVTLDEPEITKFLQAKCVACHNAGDNTAGIDLTRPAIFKPETAEHWQDVLNQIQRGAMPPDDAEPLAAEERRGFLHHLRKRMDRLAVKSSADDFRFLRLTNSQIASSWCDLLQIDRDYSSDLIEDAAGRHGHSGQSSLELTGGHVEVYLNALHRAVAEAIPDLDHPLFEVFGNVLDFPGVDPAPVREDEDPYGIETHFKYRFITLQNCSPLHSPSDTPVNNQDWVVNGDAHYVRADDQWIDAWGEDFGKENWLKLSHAGSYHPTMDKPSVYKAVMKDTSYIVIERIEFDLPWKWPVAGTEYFVDNGEFTPASITAGVRSVATRAWRHSLSPGECEELDTLIGDELANTENNAEALRNVLATVLADARFLFLNGDHATQNQSARESAQTANFQRVSWLAAFLWRSVPDQRLLQLAHWDQPLTDEELMAEVDRILADTRSRRFIADFAAAWLDFAKLNTTAVNPNYYDWWNPHFKHYMQAESIEFLSVLLQEKLSCLNCLSSDFVVVNDMMAKYYGMPKPESGHRFSRVPAPAGRSGVLTQAAFLTAHSTGEDAHAVQRAVWLKGRLLGDPPRDPPPAVPALDDLKVENVEKISTKDRLAAHRTGICYDCHKDLDPWGVAMEGFDATGKPRQRILKIVEEPKQMLQLPVDSATKVDGHAVHGMDDLKILLREKYTEDFARSFSSALMSFAIGRPLTYRDDDQLSEVTEHFQQHDYRMDELIKAIVASEICK